MAPLMFARWGGDVQRVLDVFNKALDLSSANQIESRKRSLVGYLRKIELDYQKGSLRLAGSFT
jgi:hypothetical protein